MTQQLQKITDFNAIDLASELPPVLDLAAEQLAYPAVYVHPASRKEFLFGISLKRASAWSQHEHIRRTAVSFKPSAENRDLLRIVNAPDEQYVPFVTQHFAAIHGVKKNATDEMSQEEAIAWLQANPRVCAALMQNSMLCEVVPEDYREQAPSADLVLDALVSVSTFVVTLHKFFWIGVERERSFYETNIGHRFRTPSPEESHKYRGMRHQDVATKNRKIAFYPGEDTEGIVRLYDQTIQGLEGCLFAGNACTLENKQEWIQFLSVDWKLAAARELFARVELKNV